MGGDTDSGNVDRADSNLEYPNPAIRTSKVHKGNRLRASVSQTSVALGQTSKKLILLQLRNQCRISIGVEETPETEVIQGTSASRAVILSLLSLPSCATRGRQIHMPASRDARVEQ